MKYVLLLLSILISLYAKGQDPAKQSLFKDLRMLSADDMEGRKSGEAGAEKARNYLIDRYSDLDLKPLMDDYIHEFEIDETKGIKGDKGYNIVGYLEGSSERQILLSAHYDHLGIKYGDIFNGSDDNASGVAAILAIAERLSDLNLTYTFVFAAFDAEEHGLLGARAYVDSEIANLDQVVLNINLDMVSKNDRNELYAAGSYHYPKTRPLIENSFAACPVSVLLGHDRPEQGNNDWTNSSDHAPFHDKGIPFIYFGVEDHEDYHKSTDTYDRTNFRFYSQVVDCLINFVIDLDQSDLNGINE